MVIHAAAIGDIDYCENHPETARVVNVGITESVADYCGRNRARLIYLSTDNVFDGTQGNYVEEDRPAPINEYARTKAASETIVSAAVGDAVIARVALVMGFGLLGGGNSFLERTVPMFREGRTIYVPPEEIRTPIDVVTLGRALLELAAIRLSRRDSFGGKRIARPCFADATPGRAARLFRRHSRYPVRQPKSSGGRRRPRDVSLNVAKARAVLKTPMRDFDSSIDLISA